jgi:trk system potassium uptake protein TrkH
VIAQHAGSLLKYPARVSFGWYLTVIVLGGLLLHRPACRHAEREPIRFVDALFTSTSAVCVTGLATRSTGNDYNFLGQLVIVALIQLGGVGIITVTTFAMVQLGARASLRQRSVIAESLGTGDRADLRKILRRVLYATFVCEGIGAALLTARFAFDMPFARALWFGAFHAVSAFCNAGFGLLDDSLVRYQGDVIVNLVVPALIIIGGIGFPVILDLRRHRHRPPRERWDRLTLHTKMMFLGTAVLLILGFLGFLALEWEGVLEEMPWWKRLMVSSFHSVTPRTAGFNTVDLQDLSNATLFLTILLMAVGAGPCSTAGGFKVSTLAVLTMYAWSRFRGGSRVNAFRRSVPNETVGRALTIVLIFGVAIVLLLTALLVVEQAGHSHREAGGDFLDALFEVVSAIGTVGLSTGLTPTLSDAGKAIIMLLMFLGRLGPVSVFIALSSAEGRRGVEYASEEPLLG